MRFLSQSKQKLFLSVNSTLCLSLSTSRFRMFLILLMNQFLNVLSSLATRLRLKRPLWRLRLRQLKPSLELCRRKILLL
ncbi:hypothetical protein BJY04DRAFT_202346 [Aspergillus karnatakaensis]|uniref:uncharacterized protein n=1 Tax=Aspergillus karnatakaensis TaxID=1810916 RepID=UPI003CCCE6BC